MWDEHHVKTPGSNAHWRNSSTYILLCQRNSTEAISLMCLINHIPFTMFKFNWKHFQEIKWFQGRCSSEMAAFNLKPSNHKQGREDFSFLWDNKSLGSSFSKSLVSTILGLSIALAKVSSISSHVILKYICETWFFICYYLRSTPAHQGYADQKSRTGDLSTNFSITRHSLLKWQN